MKNIPINLEECLEVLKKNLTKKDKKFILSELDSSSVHFSAGWQIRNTWKLWESESPLVKWFFKNYKVVHADDISGIILDCLWRDVRSEPRQDKQLAKQFLKHWKNYKTQK